MGALEFVPEIERGAMADKVDIKASMEHCLLIGGKLRNITRDDVIQFARDNGIRRPDGIIRDVVSSLKQFRSIATKYGVSEQWKGRVEATIIGHLKAWGEWEEDTMAGKYFMS